MYNVMYNTVHSYILLYVHVGDVYGNVQEDYFAFNKIPKILFKHQKRYVSAICLIYVHLLYKLRMVALSVLHVYNSR